MGCLSGKLLEKYLFGEKSQFFLFDLFLGTLQAHFSVADGKLLLLTWIVSEIDSTNLKYVNHKSGIIFSFPLNCEQNLQKFDLFPSEIFCNIFTHYSKASLCAFLVPNTRKC